MIHYDYTLMIQFMIDYTLTIIMNDSSYDYTLTIQFMIDYTLA